jgi:hypothetical protein
LVGWVGGGNAADLDCIGGKTNVLPNDDGGFDQGVAGVIVERTAGNIFELLVANSFEILGIVAHIGILVGGIGRKTNVLPNDDGGLDEGVAGVIVERTAGNIFELLVANGFRFLDFFAHCYWFSIWLFWIWFFGLGSQNVGS